MKIFLDTNILLDVLTKRDPFYNSSAVIWSLIEENIFKGFISAISVNNIFYISKKINNIKYARNIVDKLLSDFKIIELSYEILKLARTINNNSDYEDLIQYFSAFNYGCKYLITRNEKDFPKTGIEVINPDNFINNVLKE